MRGISHPCCSSVPAPPRARVEATYLPRPCMSPSVCGTSQGVTALPWLPGPARHGCSPSTRDGGRAGQSLVLACRSCLHRQPHQTCSCPSLSCAWLQDPVPPALGRENHQTPRTGLHSSVVKKKKRQKCSKTKPATASPSAPLCHRGQTGGGQPWPATSPGAGGQRSQGDGTWPPPCHLCTLPAFLQLLNGFCDTVLHFLVPD